MTDQEQKAIMTLVLMAAFADGRNEERERAAVKRVAESCRRGPRSTPRRCIKTSCSSARRWQERPPS